MKRSVAAVALTLASSQIVTAQETPADPSIHKVFITGSNIKRAEKEGSSPIQVISAREIAITGANNVAELLHSIPAFGTGASVDIVDGGFSKGAATASLRGLGASSTLVLLNGRRMTASAYADPGQGKSALYDLNAIPLSAIERVEIFKDGASAVYGSDAIAGVINFITKSNYRGAELGGSASADQNGKFGRQNVHGIAGIGDLDKDGYNAFVSVDLSRRDSTLSREQRGVESALYADISGRLNPYSSYLSDQPFFFPEQTPGAKNFSTANARVVNRADCDPSKQLVGSVVGHNLAASSILVGRRFCNFDLNDYNEVQSAGKDANVLSRLTVQPGPDLQAFAEAGYSRAQRSYLGAPRSFASTSPTTVFSLTGAPQQFQVILPAGHPDNPFPAARAAVGYRLVDHAGGSANVNEAYRLVAGLHGSVGAWDWETAALWHRSERTEHWNGMLYKPTLTRIMTENRTLAQTAADPSATRDVVNKGYAQVTQIDAKASASVGKLGGGDIGLAFGSEFREEKLGLTPDEVTQRGDIVGLANTSQDGRRHVSSAFAELRTPFTKSYEMDFAGRYDKYPNLKGNFVPKVGAKWTLSEQVALRSTYAEGFRAPALSQVSPGGTQSFTSITDALRCPDGVYPLPGADSSDCKKNISSTSSATPSLRPEKSKSVSLGLMLAPTKDIDVLIDYYRIKKIDETVLADAQSMVDHEAKNPGRVVRDTNPANWVIGPDGKPVPNSGPISQINRAYENQGSTEVSGIDFEVAMRKALGVYGKLTTTLNWSYLLQFRRATLPGDPTHNVAGDNGGLSDWAISADDQPRNRASWSTTWSRGEHALSGIVNYVGAVSLLRRYDGDVTYPVPYCYYGVGQPAGAYGLGGLPKFSNYNSSCDVKSWTTLGVNYTYSGIRNLTLSLNVQNLLDTKAPYDPRYPSEAFNPQLHNGMGRYFRVSAHYKFL